MNFLGLYRNNGKQNGNYYIIVWYMLGLVGSRAKKRYMRERVTVSHMSAAKKYGLPRMTGTMTVKLLGIWVEGPEL